MCIDEIASEININHGMNGRKNDSMPKHFILLEWEKFMGRLTKWKAGQLCNKITHVYSTIILLKKLHQMFFSPEVNAILYATNKGNFDMTRNLVILLFTGSSEVEEKTENRKKENERGKEGVQK